MADTFDHDSTTGIVQRFLELYTRTMSHMQASHNLSTHLFPTSLTAVSLWQSDSTYPGPITF
jgi:hypothetical protein